MKKTNLVKDKVSININLFKNHLFFNIPMCLTKNGDLIALSSVHLLLAKVPFEK